MGVEPQQLFDSDSDRRPASPHAEQCHCVRYLPNIDPAAAVLVEVLGAIADTRSLVVDLRQQLRRRQG